jgi:hypothetical protein
MPVKYIPYVPSTVQGQAILDNITRTRRVLRYRDNDQVLDRIRRGLPLYEAAEVEAVGEAGDTSTCSLLLRGECLSACAYLKANNIALDLVYIDPPFASGADYAKNVYLRRNPQAAQVLAEAEAELELDELRAFEEKMYGDIWNKEDYLNWMFENLHAIKSVMSDTASIYVHLDYHIGHYVKILLDEVFGEDNFINEIVVNRGRKKNLQSQFERIAALGSEHDVLFLYKKNDSVDYAHIRSNLRASKSQWQSFWRGNVTRETMQYDLLGFHPTTGQFMWAKDRGLRAAQNYKDFVASGETDLQDYWEKTGQKLEFVRKSEGRAYPEYFIPAKKKEWLVILGWTFRLTVTRPTTQQKSTRICSIGFLKWRRRGTMERQWLWVTSSVAAA